jgi:hypothetical protein
MNASDSKIEILSAHYSETFALLKSAVEKRDRLFVYILGIVLSLLLYMQTPSAISDWLNSFANSQAGQDPTAASQGIIDDSFVGIILGIGLLSLSHTYFQTVLHIERQYNYIYQLEKQLSPHFDEKAFIREGKHYKDHKRKFSSWTKIIFWYLFPFLFFAFNIYWIVFLITEASISIFFKAANSLITLSTLTSLGYYFWALTKKK